MYSCLSYIFYVYIYAIVIISLYVMIMMSSSPTGTCVWTRGLQESCEVFRRWSCSRGRVGHWGEPWGMIVQPYFLFPAGFLSADAMWLPGCCWVPLLCWAVKQSQPFPRQLLFSSSAAAAGEWQWRRTVVHMHLSTVDTKMALWECSLKPSFWHPNWTVEHTAQSSNL